MAGPTYNDYPAGAIAPSVSSSSDFIPHNTSTQHLNRPSSFASHDFVGQDHSGSRDSYPPLRGGVSGDAEKYGQPGDYGYEKGMNPVTRGSIAAQVRNCFFLGEDGCFSWW